MKFPLLICLFCMAPFTLLAERGTAEISWTIHPAKKSYIHDQTRLGFYQSIGRFKLERAEPFKEDGTASFLYRGRRGIITVFLGHRGLLGCERKVDCVALTVNSFCRTMEKLHGRYDRKRAFRIERRGARGGRGMSYHFSSFGGEPNAAVFSEVGSFQLGEWVYTYRGTFKQEAGLTDLGDFLRAFGARRL